LSCSIMSVTISAVMRSPSHVPHAAAFITLKGRVVAHTFIPGWFLLGSTNKTDVLLKWHGYLIIIFPTSVIQ
jgi:hypothetical protein